MSDQPEPQLPPPPPPPGGVSVAADSVTIGGDVAGRDIIKTTTIGDDLIQGDVTNVTNVGMSPQAVQRLIITVGLVVFVTAACFFAGGIFVGANVFTALNKPVNSGTDAAARFEQKIDAVAQLQPGEVYQLRFTEDELSSYLKFVLGPQIGLSNARARVLGDGQFVVYGRYDDLGGLPIMLVGSPQTGGDQLFNIAQSSAQIVPLDGGQADTVSPLGWVPMPNAVVQPLVDQALASAQQRYTFTNVSPGKPSAGAGSDTTWTVINVRAK
ncbi:MAG: hypothetical protein KA765_15425 [Thermoflexales bacterium]|nr:hypothetical protein [Thermoflexales bacterium]